MRPALLSALLLWPQFVSAATPEEIAASIGVDGSSVETTLSGDLKISGNRVLTTRDVTVQDGHADLRSVLISQEGKGDVFAASIIASDPGVVGALINKSFRSDCVGASSTLHVRGLTFSADQDALPAGQRVEIAYADSVTLSVIEGEDCFAFEIGEISYIDVTSASGDQLKMANLSFDVSGNTWSTEMIEIRFFSDTNINALSADRITFGADIEKLNAGEAVVENLSFTPAKFLYPDLLRRADISNPDQPLRVDARFKMEADDDTTVHVDVKAERLLNFSGDFSFSGTTPLTSPLTSSLIYGQVSFSDYGFSNLIKGLYGHTPEEVVRSGDVPGLPEQAKSEQFSDIRNGVADWIARGSGSVSARPETPVSLPALGAALLMFPKSIPELLNLKSDS